MQIRQFKRSDFEFSKSSWSQSGRVLDVVGQMIEASMPKCSLGTIVQILASDILPAEVVGFKNGRTLLMPYTNIGGIYVGARVEPITVHDHIWAGSHLLGHVLDPFLNSLNGSFSLSPDARLCPLQKEAPNPLKRSRIHQPLPLGVRAIDGLLTFGEGQRTGVMAGSGVGKSVLMGMIARGSSADINVIALIGERGREVREFIERELGEEGLKKSVVIAVTSDQSPLMRIRGAFVATAIAEYFSSCNKRVLLMLDSLTRVAQAQREIGLAAGEPPTTKGYPPSVYSLLPRLLERCGPQEKGHGSISGLYTVLVDGDNFNDPIPDAVRSILDGHINLSRKLASQGHFPAIEVTSSASRVMIDVVPEQHRKIATELKALISQYEENYDLIQLGSYEKGTNPKLDRALLLMPRIEEYLKQDTTKLSDYKDTIQGLIRLLHS